MSYDGLERLTGKPVKPAKMKPRDWFTVALACTPAALLLVYALVLASRMTPN